MGGKSSAPPAPDYGQIAAEQGQISQGLLQQQTTANRPNQQTPWGNLSWTSTGSGPNQQWTGTETLTPAEQQAVAGEQAGKAASTGAANTLFANGNMGSPLDFSKGPQVQSGNYYNPQAQNAVWGEFQNLQQPLQAQQTQSQQAQLEAQGLRPGDQAYDTAMHNLSNTQYQQTQSAMDQAVLAGEQEAQTMQGMDVQAQNQFINAQEAQKTGNVNLYNSLMGNNVPGVQAPNFAQSGVAQTPDLMGAAENTYGANLNATNAANAAQGNLFSGLGQMGAASLMAYAMMA